MHEDNDLLAKIDSPLLYRLIDHEPRNQCEKSSAKFIVFETLYEDIRNNLESILNSRHPSVAIPRELTALRCSLLNYGISDFSHNYYAKQTTQQQLCAEITERIMLFERRLQSVQVFPMANDIEIERVLRIRIEAQIDIAPAAMPAVFESCLDISKHAFTVET